MNHDTCFTGHTSAATPWVRGEIGRVLAKLRAQHQLTGLHVALEPGMALDAAEMALMLGIPTTLHGLYPGAELAERYQGHPGMTARLHLLFRHRLLEVAETEGSGANRARRRRRSVFLAEACHQHLVVFDGRDRGSVLDHLQHVMGTHDVIVIDPVEQSTRRIVPQGASTCPTPTSTSPAAAG